MEKIWQILIPIRVYPYQPRISGMKAYSLSTAFCIILLLWLAPTLVVTSVGAAPVSTEENPFPVFYDDRPLFLNAIAKADAITPLQTRVTGLTLPHHLIAVDIMAKALALLREQDFERIIIFSPDHFRRGQTPFSLAQRDFLTCLGRVEVDRQGVAMLLSNPLISSSNLFSHEHGVQTVLPLIAHYFPNTPVLPLSLSISSTKEQWDELAGSLLPLLTDKTLVLQSTDFSHYLSWDKALAHDRQTISIITANRLDLISQFKQPDYLDSCAAQYLQMKLQSDAYKARPTIIGHANSCDFLPAEQTRTTSYIVQLYSAGALPALNLPGMWGKGTIVD